MKRLFFLAYFCLSPLQKHVRKVVGGFEKKSCVSTGVRKPGNACASQTAMIMTLAVKVWPEYNQPTNIKNFLPFSSRNYFSVDILTSLHNIDYHCKLRLKPLTLSQTSPGFYMSAVQVLWKHSLWAISPFPTVFSTRLKNFLPFASNLPLSVWNSLKFVIWEKG